MKHEYVLKHLDEIHPDESYPNTIFPIFPVLQQLEDWKNPDQLPLNNHSFHFHHQPVYPNFYLEIKRLHDASFWHHNLFHQNKSSPM